MKVYNAPVDPSDRLLLKLSEYRSLRNFDAASWVAEKITLINDYFTQCNLTAAVLGLSGGIDSSVALALLFMASNRPASPISKIVPLMLPALNYDGATNQDDSIHRGTVLCEQLGIKARKFTKLAEVATLISDSLDEILDESPTAWSRGQLTAYSRTPVLYNACSILTDAGFPAIVIGTTNLSEGGYLGYVGKASDGLVDLQIISDLYKSEVYAVARYLKLPEVILEAIPSGDMYDGRNDEEVFGASYDFVELYHLWLQYGSDPALLADEQFVRAQKNLEGLHTYNSHKYTYGSPAVHPDILDAKIPNGWNNPVWRKK